MQYALPYRHIAGLGRYDYHGDGGSGGVVVTAAAIAAAKADPAVAAALEGKQVVKEIYVKGRLVNLAVKG